jgi:hypothetical protein
MASVPTIDAATRRAWLHATEAQLLAQCQVDRYRASGPGGQHRNKTESAVRVRHAASGQVAIGEDSRSQHENRSRAVRRLREKIALSVRVEVDLQGYAPRPALAAVLAGGTARLGEKTRQTPAYLEAMAELLDVLVATGGEVARLAALLGVTTGATSKLLLHDDHVATVVGAVRGAHGLRPLR